MLSLYHHIKSLLERRRRARRFAVPYTRDRNWIVPRHLIVDGKAHVLALPNDQGTSLAFKDIFISDVYGLEARKNLPRTIVDIGAHAGLFSLAARLYFPDAVIHAYEPNPEVWPLLASQASIGLFTPFPTAVGNAGGRAVLSNTGDSVFNRCLPSQEGTIEVISLAEAVNRVAGNDDLDLLKLDCEGAEWDILQDVATMQRVRSLTLEYHLEEGRTLEALLAILQALKLRIDFLHRDGEANGRIWASRN